MCLIYYTAGNLVQATEEGGRCTGRWDRDEGTKVANLLGEKSLLSTSAFEGKAQVKANSAEKKVKNDPCLQLKQIFICKHVESVAASCSRSDPALCRSFSFFFLHESPSYMCSCAHIWWKRTSVWFRAFASGMELSQGVGESQNRGPRKQWAVEPSQTVVQRLANASLMSSGSLPSTNQSPAGSAQENETAINFLSSSFEQNSS